MIVDNIPALIKNAMAFARAQQTMSARTKSADRAQHHEQLMQCLIDLCDTLEAMAPDENDEAEDEAA